MIKAVVFDMGGVIHTVEHTQERHLRFAADTIAYLAEHDIGIPDPPDVFEAKLAAADDARRAHNEKTLRETPPLEAWSDFYLKEYGIPKGKIFPIADQLCFRWSKDRGIDKPRPGAGECMAALREMGMRMGIISNTLSRTYVFHQLSAYGISRYFECVLLSSVCGLRKPGREIFDLCATVMNMPREEMAYVGDTISRDVIGVRSAGWGLMIRLLHPEAKPKVLERERKLEESGHTPDFTITQLPEVAEIIRAHNQTSEQAPF